MGVKPARLIGGLLLVNGATSLLVSLYVNSSVLALIGLGLVFWGALLLSMESKKYVQRSLLNATSLSLLELIDQFVSFRDFRGNAVYLPPKYFPEPKHEKMFINRGDGCSIPPIDVIANDRMLVDQPPGLLVTPPGLALTNLYEEVSGLSFTDLALYYDWKMNLDRLKDRLVKLFIDDLEIARHLELDVLEDTILVKLTEHIFRDICLTKSATGCRSLSCPLCSSLALTFTRISNRPVTIQKTTNKQNGAILEVQFQIHEA